MSGHPASLLPKLTLGPVHTSDQTGQGKHNPSAARDGSIGLVRSFCATVSPGRPAVNRLGCLTSCRSGGCGSRELVPARSARTATRARDETSSLPAPANAAGALSTWLSSVKALAHWKCTFCARAGAAAKVKSVTAKSTLLSVLRRDPPSRGSVIRGRCSTGARVSVPFQSRLSLTRPRPADPSPTVQGRSVWDDRADRGPRRVASPWSERSSRGASAGLPRPHKRPGARPPSSAAGNMRPGSD